MKSRFARWICLPALWPAAVFAFQPLITDDTGTQGAGGNQIEVGYNRTVEKTPGAKEVSHEVPLFFARGITDALDLYVGLARMRVVPGAPAATENGWGNTAVGAKWRFYENDASKLSFALKPEIQLPVSDSREARGLGNARAGYSLGLLMSKETGFGAVHANLSVDRVNYADAVLDAAERRTQYRLSVAPVWDVAEKWKLALDVGAMTNADRAERARMGYVELGAIFSPDKDLDLALGVIRNIMDGGVRTTQLTMGLTWRFR